MLLYFWKLPPSNSSPDNRSVHFPCFIKTSKSPNPKEICRSRKIQNPALQLPRAYKLSSASVVIRRMKKSSTLGLGGRGGAGGGRERSRWDWALAGKEIRTDLKNERRFPLTFRFIVTIIQPLLLEEVIRATYSYYFTEHNVSQQQASKFATS